MIKELIEEAVKLLPVSLEAAEDYEKKQRSYAQFC